MLWALPAAAIDVGDLLGTPPVPVDVRVINEKDGTLLLSSDERLLAVMRLRPAGNTAPEELLSLADAKAAMAASKPLNTGVQPAARVSL